MKSIRKIDELGRVVIPQEMRNELKLKQEDEVEMYVHNKELIIQKSQDCCLFCGSLSNLKEFTDKHICENCIDKLNKL